MNQVFPDPIRNLPEADIPIDGIKAYLSQSDSHQIIFMEFEKDVDLPEHSHAAQIGIVLEGKIEMTINGEKTVYNKGDKNNKTKRPAEKISNPMENKIQVRYSLVKTIVSFPSGKKYFTR